MGAADSLDACNGSQQVTNWENSRITYQLLKLEECRWFRSGRQESPRAKKDPGRTSWSQKTTISLGAVLCIGSLVECSEAIQWFYLGWYTAE